MFQKGYSKAEEETMERAKRIYRDELIDGIERQKRIRDDERSYLRLPVSHFVPVSSSFGRFYT